MTRGVSRCLQPVASGRGFLQSRSILLPDHCPSTSHFFESLKSARQLALCTQLNARLCQQAASILPDPLAASTALDGFDIYAGDGHFHAHACHDAADFKGVKRAVGHLYARNLRSGCPSHLTLSDQLATRKEHDMRCLKRLTLDALRQGAMKGRKVLYIWDRAGIDFAQWHQWKQGSGIYMLSRCKSNMALSVCGNLPFDARDDLNAGIVRDDLVGTGTNGLLLRRIMFADVAANRRFEFLTNVLDSNIAPGLLAHLYRMRWDIEMSFDELKNKLGEQKAWASSPTAKIMQAQLLCLSFNLLHLLDHQLAQEGISYVAEHKRRDKRMTQTQQEINSKKALLPKALSIIQNLTQHSVKLIR